MNMKTIGKIDKADFPEFYLSDISIKIDTGAYTSSIHSHHGQEIEIDGEKYLEFQLMDPEHPEYNDRVFTTQNYSIKTIKNSFGQSEQRFIIETEIILFNTSYPIELSLSERSDMKFPILIGRKLLNNQFIVDTAQKNISFALKKI